MPTGNKQIRNDQMESLLAGSFTTRKEFMQDGARLLSAVKATHRQGGGDLRWGWMADSPALVGRANAANQHFTENNITSADYFATTNGAPYVDFNGATEYLSAGDRTWAEVGTEEFFVWAWCNADTLTTNDRIIVSKWGNGAGNRQWHLCWDVGNTAFQFEVSNDGTAISAVTSSYTERTIEWYFVAGYYYINNANGLRIYVGEASDAVLTTDTAASPATVFTGGASALEIASENAGTNLWDGKIGIAAMRNNVPSGAAFAGIDGYAARLFHLTRWFYQA
jgi:hypothetical protein